MDENTDYKVPHYVIFRILLPLRLTSSYSRTLMNWMCAEVGDIDQIKSAGAEDTESE
jgi:hypothetical protein